MAVFVIGDVQGCFTTLQRLLDRIGFDPARDRLWLVGDLVNRGPNSLEVVRWAMGLGDRVTAVLGNHDLHLVSVAEGARRRKRADTLDEILAAPDLEAIVEWFLARPLVHREGDNVMVHAGLPPGLTLDEAYSFAWDTSEALRSWRRHRLLAKLQDTERPARLHPDLQPTERTAVLIDAFTRIRTVKETGEMCHDFKGHPSSAPEGCRPWFELATIPKGKTVYFGHWAALGLYQSQAAVGLDTGCVWGRSLTAIRLSDRKVFQEPSEIGQS